MEENRNSEMESSESDKKKKKYLGDNSLVERWEKNEGRKKEKRKWRV
jgi:hypothetical protein